MRKHAFKATCIVSAALLATLASPADAEMYKWVNEDGTTTYSNQPPGDDSGVNEFTTVDIPRMDSPKPIVIEPTALPTQPQQPKAEVEVPTARPSIRAQLPPAVQDPCLTSWDKLCYVKNKEKYKPYVGYAPHETTVAEAPAVVPPARGAANGASGGGAVSGGTKRLP